MKRLVLLLAAVALSVPAIAGERETNDAYLRQRPALQQAAKDLPDAGKTCVREKMTAIENDPDRPNISMSTVGVILAACRA